MTMSSPVATALVPSAPASDEYLASDLAALDPTPKRKLPSTWLAVLVLTFGSLISALAFVGMWGRDIERRPLVVGPGPTTAAPERPEGLYVEIDVQANRLRVSRRDQLLREAVISTGTGILLRDPRDGREWVFDTPLGERRVLRKKRDPVWTKPDWAFVEQGLVPPVGGEDRYDDVSLGDYALDLGDGYLIHGTLFQSLLGTRATHGCIRVGDEDLEYLFRNVPVGTRVFIY